ncbi:MAG: hypothetical protein ILP16_05535, partial [Spirochaetales bacterium]|nr:hypothetical protein [Spirochaetales bacterium]
QLLILLFVMIALALLVGCSKYVSHYSAMMLVTEQSSKAGSISFSSFSGTKVFKLKSDGHLNYSAKLDEGSATVYYDDGTKSELFSIGAGQEIKPSSATVGSGTVYVIVQTDGKCKGGSFSFDVK